MFKKMIEEARAAVDPDSEESRQAWDTDFRQEKPSPEEPEQTVSYSDPSGKTFKMSASKKKPISAGYRKDY